MICITLCNHLEGEEKAGCFAFIDLQSSFYCKCSMALPHGAVWVGQQRVIVVFPDHTRLLLFYLEKF